MLIFLELFSFPGLLEAQEEGFLAADQVRNTSSESLNLLDPEKGEEDSGLKNLEKVGFDERKESLETNSIQGIGEEGEREGNQWEAESLGERKSNSAEEDSGQLENLNWLGIEEEKERVIQESEEVEEKNSKKDLSSEEVEVDTKDLKGVKQAGRSQDLKEEKKEEKEGEASEEGDSEVINEGELRKGDYPLVINELKIGDEKSSSHDWVEIHNLSQKELSLDSCKLRKLSSSGKDYSLKSFGKTDRIEAGGYFVWANSKDGFAESLEAQASTRATLAKNNCVILLCEGSDSNSKKHPEDLVDGICWGEEGQFSSQAQERLTTKEAFFAVNPGDDQSVARQEKENSSLAINDFSLTIKPTPGRRNQFPPPPEPQKYPRVIYFSEVLSNPEGKDQSREWVELFNAGSQETVSLAGWQLENGSGKHFQLPELEIVPREYLIIKIVETSLSIRNVNEVLRLLDPNEAVVDEIYLSGSASAGASFSREFSLISLKDLEEESVENSKESLVELEESGDESGSEDTGESQSKKEVIFEGLASRELVKREGWGRIQTPGEANQLNNLPKFKIQRFQKSYRGIYTQFDARDSFDPDKDKLKFRWDFGDGHYSYLATTRHKYQKKGTYQVTLRLDDGSTQVFKSFQLKVREFPRHELKIVGLLANPKGQDSEGEMLIIKNNSKEDLNLKDYKVATGKDEDSLSNHLIYDDFKIETGEERELPRGELCKFSLLNKAGMVELRYPDDKTADRVIYRKEEEGAIEEGEWYWLREGDWTWQGEQGNSSQKELESIPEVWGGVTVADLGRLSPERAWDLRRMIYYREDLGECLNLEGVLRENWQLKHSHWFILSPSFSSRLALRR